MQNEGDSMGDAVQSLLEFHRTRNFGSRENLIARQQEARATYLSLSSDQQAELAEFVLTSGDQKNDRAWEILCCLACFQPGSLRSFHKRLISKGMFYPAVIFHGANANISDELLTWVEKDEHRNHVLEALAWIGDAAVQAAFAGWRENPPAWSAQLFVPPEFYAHQAGWELQNDGTRRDLFYPTAFPLVRSAVKSEKAAVQTGIASGNSCHWCGRQMTNFLMFDDISEFLPKHGSREVVIQTCDVCVCFGAMFGVSGSKPNWHLKNGKPAYVPEDGHDWPTFPEQPLFLSGQTRHFLEAANWSMLPAVSFSQIGGIATWIQDADYPTCPDCSSTMPFIGQISNEDFDNGEGIYYCHHCPKCNISATTYQQT